MPIKVRTNDGFNAGLTAGTNIPGQGSPSFSSTPLTHKDIDNNFKSVWPVGSVYFNISTDLNPRQLLGFGTWQAFGQKTVLVGKVDGIPPSSGIVSRKITAAKPLVSRSRRDSQTGRLGPVTNSRLEITLTPDNAPFSVGQKITLSGLTNSENNNVILNREREILSLGDADGNSRGTKLIVDYTSPSSDTSNNAGIFGGGSTSSISASSHARATLFGTLYSNLSPYMLKGQGGEFSHNLTRDEMPKHRHAADLVEDGKSGNEKESDIEYLHRPAIRASDGGNDSIKLSGRAHGGGTSNRDNLNSTMRGFSHENTMPFVTCYMWLRVY